MKALILAAGLGSRLENKTKHVPKALVTFEGRPILDFQIKALISNNIKDFIIVLGKEGDKIINYMSIITSYTCPGKIYFYKVF